MEAIKGTAEGRRKKEEVKKAQLASRLLEATDTVHVDFLLPTSYFVLPTSPELALF